MHGVKRGEKDPARDALKKEKAVKYNQLSSEVVRRRREEILDEQSMELTTKVLEINPEFYTAWNLRRLIIEDLLKSDEQSADEGLEGGGGASRQGRAGKILKEELALSQAAIAKNAKVYCLWHHRLWAVDRCVQLGDREVLRSELALCTQLLQLDERNFHCWGYRQAIARRSRLSAKDGLDFTKDKIDRNFSNYSAWHYRSAFLQQASLNEEKLREDGTEPQGARDAFMQALASENELVQGACFTDPADQSAWLYLRWEPVLCRPRRLVHGPSSLSEAWAFTPTQTLQHSWEACVVSVLGSGDVVTGSGRTVGACHMRITQRQWRADVLEDQPAPKEQFQNWQGALAKQLTQCAELLELEPGCKWAMLTRAFLLSLKHRASFSFEAESGMDAERSELEELIQKLQEVDHVRASYYSHIGSNVRLDEWIRNWASHREPSRHASITDSSLSHLDPTTLSRLAGITSLHLNNNELRNCSGLHVLAGLRSLAMDNNRIDSLWSLQPLTSLTCLSLKNNRVTSVSQVEALFSLSNWQSLKELRLDGNGMQTRVQEALRNALPGTEMSF